MMRGLWAAVILALFAGAEPVQSGPHYERASWSGLTGWTAEDHRAALDVFLVTCPNLKASAWVDACRAARAAHDARDFFEAHFTPVIARDGRAPLFTGYYEPELTGSPVRTETYRHPIYAKPPEVTPGERWKSREEIESARVLEGRGLEIAWLSDPVETFFLHIQGSGRIALNDGTAIRVGFGGSNGHPYRSVGQELARRGILAAHKVSAAAIRTWVNHNPTLGRAMLWHNPRFIFFREVSEVPIDKGPLGAMNRSITPLRSVAVDPAFVPLGAPVWIETEGGSNLQRLMIAQDTGAAIKGAQRADIFYGTGAEAGRLAGNVRDWGRLVMLLPHAIAADLVAGG